jgi:hypothetical protein
MTAFRLLLLTLGTILTVFTVIVVRDHGIGLFPIFFGDIAKLGWPGQFNLDFMFMLTLATLWVAWRNNFSTSGIGLALIVPIGGSVFLTLYLLVLSFQTGGNVKAMLIGEARAAR